MFEASVAEQSGPRLQEPLRECCRARLGNALGRWGITEDISARSFCALGVFPSHLSQRAVASASLKKRFVVRMPSVKEDLIVHDKLGRSLILIFNASIMGLLALMQYALRHL
jgi:hypothetical protein